MKKQYKKIYILLSIMIVSFLSFFTIVNLFVYGSIMQINIPILSLVIIFPLYTGFREKHYVKFAAYFMSTILIMVLIATVILLPDYTFNEAREQITEETGETWEPHLKRFTGESNFIYAGDYLVETKENSYLFDIDSGNYERIEGE